MVPSARCPSDTPSASQPSQSVLRLIQKPDDCHKNKQTNKKHYPVSGPGKAVAFFFALFHFFANLTWRHVPRGCALEHRLPRHAFGLRRPPLAAWVYHHIITLSPQPRLPLPDRPPTPLPLSALSTSPLFPPRDLLDLSLSEVRPVVVGVCCLSVCSSAVCHGRGE